MINVFAQDNDCFLKFVEWYLLEKRSVAVVVKLSRDSDWVSLVFIPLSQILKEETDLSSRANSAFSHQ
ncbi:hypothetical protein P5673_020758 [Acropora cervicornis]|uniref:Uncharacterized protein n=1 Tax=Acropora cervicornis TaxID=6130 RepID=A0AAD9Q9L5_ACRCE|nr:hypothetical protein P5673_020758 [Acropora cervicornis]